jgi:hypothetical protein
LHSGWPGQDSNLGATDYEGGIRGLDARGYGRLSEAS